MVFRSEFVVVKMCVVVTCVMVMAYSEEAMMEVCVRELLVFVSYGGIGEGNNGGGCPARQTNFHLTKSTSRNLKVVGTDIFFSH